MIGVNLNSYEAKKLKEVMDRERMNWRSFADQGTINTEWNVPGTPTYYILDQQGVIRYRWYTGNPGEKAIDKAIDTLLKEAPAR